MLTQRGKVLDQKVAGIGQIPHMTGRRLQSLDGPLAQVPVVGPRSDQVSGGELVEALGHGMKSVEQCAAVFEADPVGTGQLIVEQSRKWHALDPPVSEFGDDARRISLCLIGQASEVLDRAT
ncbi:hypothetical protein AGRA3207_007484 [Actinomadura graeca]|uniref:Uncharacterized protein n=1 Tax=Actinomadura graeca TaxID=2750812 RepID=A0ABX8R4A2_9ACTN|nr:hypothetical protein [Actinomadura graeca]QXJ25915.1 hypothetical protein AGRA3207_007484 [Actinomadura graeca]